MAPKNRRPNRRNTEQDKCRNEIVARGNAPDDRRKKEWSKWLRHSDPRIAFEAFKLANAYLFGKPVQAAAGEELAPPIRIDISAIPTRHVKTT